MNNDDLLNSILNLSIKESLELIEKLYKKFPILKQMNLNSNKVINSNNSEVSNVDTKVAKKKSIYLTAFSSVHVEKIQAIMRLARYKKISTIEMNKEASKLPILVASDADENTLKDLKVIFDKFNAKLELK